MAAFVDGWFRTGDLGSIDAEGFLKVSGRIKEFINRGGEKISPYEIEQALLRHADVREAAAFALPHPRLGENVAVSVVLAAGANTTATEIKTFLADQLTPFKIPQQVFFTSALPKGATGKVLRLQLVEAALRRTRNIAPPEGPFHFQILEIWQRLLGRDDIGIDDDFFEAGGDSLLAIQMVCELETLIGQQVSLSALRAVFTIRELAAAVAEASSPKTEMVTCAKQGDGTPFFFCHGDYANSRTLRTQVDENAALQSTGLFGSPFSQSRVSNDRRNGGELFTANIGRTPDWGVSAGWSLQRWPPRLGDCPPT